jgi:hypothetical protein
VTLQIVTMRLMLISELDDDEEFDEEFDDEFKFVVR